MKLAGIPEQNCKTLFLIGGVPFKMAKMQKKGDERYTVLSTKISDYDELIKKEGDKMKSGINIYKAIVDATCAEQVVFDWDANFAIGFLLNMKWVRYECAEFYRRQFNASYRYYLTWHIPH